MKLITKSFNVLIANGFAASIANNTGASYTYVFLGRPQPYDDDDAPPTLLNSFQETHVSAYEDMIVGKLLSPDDVSIMIPRNDWVQHTAYRRYDHTTALADYTDFYVGVQEGDSYNVFKCLDNNGGANSTVAPSLSDTAADDEIYITADNYQWKYMYTVSIDSMNKFATSLYVPVQSNANVVGNAVSGAIDNIIVSYPGSNYIAYGNGSFQTIAVGGNNQIFVIESYASSNNNFYDGSAIKIVGGTGAGQQRTIDEYSVSGSTKTIVIDEPFTTIPDATSQYEITPRVVVTGSGNNFTGRALVNATSNSIYKVEVTDRGSNYLYATASVVGNTGGISNNATLSIAIGPHGGHGAAPAEELNGRHFCLSTTFSTSNATAEGKLFTTNDFRTIGLLSTPLFANVEIDITGLTGTYDVGDTVTQTDTGAVGTVTFANTTVLRMTNVYKFFLPGNSTINTIYSQTSANAQVSAVRNNGSANLTSQYEYIDQTSSWTINSTTGEFEDDEVLYVSNVATQNAFLFSANSTTIRATNVRGDFTGNVMMGATSGAIANVETGTYRSGDLVINTGEVIYIENMSPVTRSETQKETVKLIFKV